VTDYDVVVVGASIAGNTAALLFGRAGLRVALVERNRDMESYKAMCGHFILGGTMPTLERMGLLSTLVDAGGELCWARVWSGSEWIERARDDVPAALGLQRRVLDPLLRRTAAATPGVDLFLGASVRDLVRDERGRVTGIVTSDEDGERTITARLVVGADGHRSAVGTLAGAAVATAPNPHFFWWTYYAGVRRECGDAQVWPADPDGAVVTPAGNGLTLVGAFPSKARLPEFAADRVGAIERYVSQFPDAPDLASAERVSTAVGTSDYPFVKRDPVQPGLALIGDAAMAADPLPAVGCGWAFRSAEWLADATTAALLDGVDAGAVDAGLARYRDARAVEEEYEDLTGDAPTPEQIEMSRGIRRAAARDSELARRLALFAMRAAPPSVLRNRDTVERVMAMTALPHRDAVLRATTAV
jgi:2-polyprenyl-6-methoxyphenol hydroxylase-like FAD-dependent oxidoreductase